MLGIFSYAAAPNPAFVTGGTAGLAADRGHAAHAPAPNLPLAYEVGPVASRGQSQEVWRMFT